MSTTALGIVQDASGSGVSPHTHRKTIQARWNNPGIVYGLDVTGGAGLAYSVSAGVAVVQRSVADGCTEAYWEGGDTPAVSAGDPSNPRIDAVWIKANDPQQGDASNLVQVGVTQGTPSSSPVRPAVPAGCNAVAYMRVPAGATSTSAAAPDGDGTRAIPYGASLGLVLDLVDTSNADVTSAYTACMGSVTLPTARYLSLKVTVTMSANDGPWADGDGSVYCYLRVDGQNVDGRELRLRGGANAISNYYEKVVKVGEGTHQISLYINPGVSKSNRRYWNNGGWAGQCLQVLDIGAVS